MKSIRARVEDSVILPDIYNFKYQEPQQCPLCLREFINLPMKSTVIEKNGNIYMYLLYVCTNCCKGFIAEYSSSYIKEPINAEKDFVFPLDAELSPVKIYESNFNPEINQISPDFIKIYNEAYAAEQHNLLKICGMGYRKALEFLIKDYLIYKYPDMADSIKKDTLGNCIANKNYGFDERVRSVAERCAWLGNDHSHYIAKHTDRDLNDLKNLLNITVTWITLILQSEEALKIAKK